VLKASAVNGKPRRLAGALAVREKAAVEGEDPVDIRFFHMAS